MKNRIDDLRNHLFVALERLGDEKKPMDLETAKATVEVARALIDSARVEIEYMQVTGRTEGTGFIPDAPSRPRLASGQ